MSTRSSPLLEKERCLMRSASSDRQPTATVPASAQDEQLSFGFRDDVLGRSLDTEAVGILQPWDKDDSLAKTPFSVNAVG